MTYHTFFKHGPLLHYTMIQHYAINIPIHAGYLIAVYVHYICLTYTICICVLHRILLYDKRPGGLGICNQLYNNKNVILLFESLLLLRACPCELGCVACILQQR